MGRAVALEGLAASVLCLVPAMAALLWFLDRYEGYFDQRKTFFTLAVGLFAGIVVRVFEVLFFPFDNLESVQRFGAGFSFAYTAVGFALIETFAKLVVLGSRKFRARPDTPFYAPALGLAVGAMVALQVVTVSLSTSGALAPVTTSSIVVLVAILIFAMGLILTNGASAVRIAKHVADGRLWHGLLVGFLWQLPMAALFWMWSLTVILHRGAVALLALAWGGLAAWFAQRNVLEKVVPPEIRDQVRRARRREQRKARI